MSEVKRWEPENTVVGYNMKPTPDGSFVLSGDYDRLAAENERLNSELGEANRDFCRVVNKLEALKQQEPKLDKPAKVGAAIFGVGVKLSTVIGAAQRQYEYAQELPDSLSLQDVLAAALPDSHPMKFADCATCSGVGIVGHSALCPECDGAGEQQAACDTCNGVGMIGDLPFECPGCSGWKHVDDIGVVELQAEQEPVGIVRAVNKIYGMSLALELKAGAIKAGVGEGTLLYAAPPSVSGLVEALEFYANGDHLLLAEPDDWDTCSGEPANFLHDDAGTASVEDGSIAKAALAAHRANGGE